MRPIRRVVVMSVVALVGWAVGWLAGSIRHVLPHPVDYPFLAEYVPLPHHVPKDLGGLSFRFAMAHDVVHERFPRHGPAHYKERERLTRERLSSLPPDDPARFPLADDLAAGMERLGRSDEAVAVMRDKLDRQRAMGLTGRDLYTSYANLGTFLIHGSSTRAVAGDPVARAQFRDGVGFIREAVAVNPQAHFGRERWQAAIAEFLLAAMDDPKLLTTFDCLGNRLGLPIEDILNREANWIDTGYGRPTDAAFAQGKVDAEVPAFFLQGMSPENPSWWPQVSPIRRHITRVGAEAGWDAVMVPSHREPVAFDEPAMGIIGMWRQGGGANPHFALALGETLLRTGQRYVAWAAFERAARMADRFWPDPDVQQALRVHCRTRQAQIEETLSYRPSRSDRRPAWQHVSPPPSSKVVAGLRSNFDAELAHGEGYQREYQRYEEERIAAGVRIDDEHFFDDFHAARAPIASPDGPEEWFARVPRAAMQEYARRSRRAWGVFGAGIAAMGWTLVSRWRQRREAA